MKIKQVLGISLLVLIVSVIVACSNDAATDNNQINVKEHQEGETFAGDVVIDGSGTVYPLMAKIAEQYMLAEQPNVSVEVSRSGTGAGFKKLLVEDGTDFNNASREIKEEEVKLAEQLDLNIQQIKVALDGLTFVIHPENDWAKEMTDEQIKQIFLNDSSVELWSDIDSDWPDEPINKYGPNENHGTYEFFYENILDEQEMKEDVDLQQEYSTLVNVISEDENGIAFFGYGYYVNNQAQLQAVHVDFGEGAVEPTLETIAEDGPYAPFTRPVFTYLNVKQALERQQVFDFALYLTKNLNEFAEESGFAPLPEEDITETINKLESLQQ